MDKSWKTIIEPFRIKTVEPLGFTTEAERLRVLKDADYNVFGIPADKVLIDRKENRHAAFGLGIHRCVGSNLARMEMTVAIGEWLKRIPDFRLDPAGQVTWSEGTVRGPRQLPMLFGKAG